jgi:nicotinate phosphoribosyltransferase
MPATRILASGDLNEYRIERLLRRRAAIDAFGVGTELVTSFDAPALGGVYKLVEQQTGGRSVPRLKESPDKQTYPGRKQVWRRADRRGRSLGDVIALDGEPQEGEPLLRPVLRAGKLVEPLPPLEAARERATASLAALPRRVTRLSRPQRYPVAWSAALRDLRDETLRRLHGK